MCKLVFEGFWTGQAQLIAFYYLVFPRVFLLILFAFSHLVWLGSWVGFFRVRWLVDELMCKYRGMLILSAIHARSLSLYKPGYWKAYNIRFWYGRNKWQKLIYVLLLVFSDLLDQRWTLRHENWFVLQEHVDSTYWFKDTVMFYGRR